MKVENTPHGAIINIIGDKPLEPFKGAIKYKRCSKLTSLNNALKKCDLKDGDTLSHRTLLREEGQKR